MSAPTNGDTSRFRRAVLVGWLTLAGAACAQENLLTNGSFDTPDPDNAARPQGWRLQGEGAYVDGGHEGKCVMVKGKWSLFDQKVALTPNAAYKVSCWIKGTAPGDLGQLVFFEIRKTDTTWKDWDLYVRVTGEWTKFEKTYQFRSQTQAKDANE